MIAELLQTQALVSSQATKEQVMAQIQEAECVHIASHVSWKLSSIVLSPAEVILLLENRINRLFTKSDITGVRPKPVKAALYDRC